MEGGGGRKIGVRRGIGGQKVEGKRIERER